ncbi:hypothetical protein SYNPS1DRAFT_22204 [Syncephalis pseudoplumigaleata]|uniref:Uncharacterized protein n=1 Tax=Syncephalis pseudoplumigaleata TaxID=1712513 RepID=A0A4P9Z2C7_9FUNG|nr:hypothetical protein SYNPS1DRAFT_22204 [Syncephalis pseudoplumigaleata]|eukprot:RKP25931.1 hypothetical protein SYNPS1DRAFT_22204 [Syncephalis pseudoplumigaleata]
MTFLKRFMPGAEQRRAEKLADTVRDIIIGQQTASLLYASGSTLSDGTVMNPDSVLAIATTPATKAPGSSGSGSKEGELADGRRIAFSPSTKPADGALMAAAVSMAEPADATSTADEAKIQRGGHKKHRRHKHRHNHSHHKQSEKRRVMAQQKALKRLQRPDTLSAVLDILRLMPNPFKTQSLMQQMFQHDWRSMSMPDLLAEERARTIGRHGRCGNNGNDGSADDDDDDLPPETIEAHTYWWGYEIYIPPRTLQKLEDEGDVATGVLYFLGALSKTVPLIYPFVNMIATYVAMQFTIIKAADRGNGIILVATWVLPIVLVPKPWEDRFRETLRERIPIDM